MKPQLPWLLAGVAFLALGSFVAFTSSRPEALVYAAIPAAAVFVVGGLVWSRGPA